MAPDGQRLRMQHTNRHGRTYEFETPYEGVMPNLTRRYRETESVTIKQEIEGYMTALPCPTCKGARLKPESLAVTVAGRSIVDVSRLSIRDAADFFAALAGDRAEGQRGTKGRRRRYRAAANGHAGPPLQCPCPLRAERRRSAARSSRRSGRDWASWSTWAWTT